MTPEPGAYIVEHGRWEATYPANVSADTARLYHDGRWLAYDLDTLVNDGAKFIPAGEAALKALELP